MSVLDLLPHCVSGVYFIYHRDFEKWSFGKLSALREIALAEEQGYRFYYMGYYIHDCAKMRYKNDYGPQYFLDLENLEFDPLDEEALGLMGKRKYVSTSRDLVSKVDAKETLNEESEEMGNGWREVRDSEERQAFDTPSEASEAVDEGLSLFKLDFPGMMTADEVEEKIDLDFVKLRIRGGRIVRCDVSFGFQDFEIRRFW